MQGGDTFHHLPGHSASHSNEVPAPEGQQTLVGRRAVYVLDDHRRGGSSHHVSHEGMAAVVQVQHMRTLLREDAVDRPCERGHGGHTESRPDDLQGAGQPTLELAARRQDRDIMAPFSQTVDHELDHLGQTAGVKGRRHVQDPHGDLLAAHP